jgi:hypothetical protein
MSHFPSLFASEFFLFLGGRGFISVLLVYIHPYDYLLALWQGEVPNFYEKKYMYTTKKWLSPCRNRYLFLLAQWQDAVFILECLKKLKLKIRPSRKEVKREIYYCANKLTYSSRWKDLEFITVCVYFNKAAISYWFLLLVYHIAVQWLRNIMKRHRIMYNKRRNPRQQKIGPCHLCIFWKHPQKGALYITKRLIIWEFW